MTCPFKTCLIIAAAALVAMSGASRASDAEREYLTRIAHELDALAPLVNAAEDNAGKSERIRFRYDWLRRDIRRIREGVLEHATADQAEPRQYAPLRGDYRR